MALRRSTADRLEGLQRAIETARSNAAAARDEAAKCRQLAAARETLVDELAEAEAVGNITRAEVDKKLDEADRAQAAHLRNAAQREALAAKCDENVERHQREIAQTYFEEQLAKTGKPYEVKIYDGANHAFFNDTGGAYNAATYTAGCGSVAGDICGTAADPPDIRAQRQRLRDAGAFVFETNAAAVDSAARLLSAARVVAKAGGAL